MDLLILFLIGFDASKSLREFSFSKIVFILLLIKRTKIIVLGLMTLVDIVNSEKGKDYLLIVDSLLSIDYYCHFYYLNFSFSRCMNACTTDLSC